MTGDHAVDRDGHVLLRRWRRCARCGRLIEPIRDRPPRPCHFCRNRDRAAAVAAQVKATANGTRTDDQ